MDQSAKLGARSLVPGKILGPYEILAPLGAGGMGEVYRGRETRLERDVAIKALPDHLSRGQRALSGFQREVKVVAAHDEGIGHRDLGPENIFLTTDGRVKALDFGLADEIINALTRIEGLSVASRSSSFQFKDSARDIRNVGEALNVSTVLEGSAYSLDSKHDEALSHRIRRRQRLRVGLCRPGGRGSDV